MAYDYEFIDGFDKYGPYSRDIEDALKEGEWTYSLTGGVFAYTPLADTPSGYSMQMLVPNGATTQINYLTKTLPDSFVQSIGGVTFLANLNRSNGVVFYDGSTPQFCVQINDTTGLISVRRGDINGTVIATALQSCSHGVEYTLEWDVVFNNATGAYKIWLNGVVTSLDATGVDTCATSNNYVNRFGAGCQQGPTGGEGVLTWDHLYTRWYLAAGAEDPLLTNPIIETQFPDADSAVDFTPVTAVLGATYVGTTDEVSPGANQLVLRKYTPEIDATLDSISIIIGSNSSATIKFKGVVYSDTAGVPDALLSSGTEVVGATFGTTKTFPLVTPQALTGGTPVWIGYITDTSLLMAEQNSTTTLGYKASNTYGSGAPNPAPAMTANQASWVIWGNCTTPAENWGVVNENPPVGDLSYVTSSTPLDTDLFEFPPLLSVATNIYTVAVKINASRTESGPRLMDMVVDSGGTEGTGDTTNIPPTPSYSWIGSYFNEDPDTASAWVQAGLEAALSGYRIAS